MINKNDDYNSIAYRKKILEKRKAFISSILVAEMIFSSVSFLSGVNYELKHENPFNGNTIKHNNTNIPAIDSTHSNPVNPTFSLLFSIISLYSLYIVYHIFFIV